MNHQTANRHQLAGLRHLDRSSGGGGRFIVKIVWLAHRLLQFSAPFGRQVVHRTEPAQLQSAQVSDDGPAILDRDLRPVSAHIVLAVADVLKMAIGLLDDALSCRFVTTAMAPDLFRDAVAFAGWPWQGAINRETRWPRASNPVVTGTDSTRQSGSCRTRPCSPAHLERMNLLAATRIGCSAQRAGRWQLRLRPLANPLAVWAATDWRSMSGRLKAAAGNIARLPAISNTSTTQTPREGSSALFLHHFDALAAGGFQQFAGFRLGVFRIGRLDDHVKLVMRRQGEAFVLEQRMMQPRQAVENNMPNSEPNAPNRIVSS
jgi:hypothetical protein